MTGYTTKLSGYTTRDVAEIVGLNTDQVRHYVRRKLVQPTRGERGEYRFSFQDVVLIRTAKGLVDASVTTRKAYRALVKLKAELAQVHSLSAVRIFADGSSIVMRDEQNLWEVETGQSTIDFSALARGTGLAKQSTKGGPNSTDARQYNRLEHLGSDQIELDAADRSPGGSNNWSTERSTETLADNVARIANRHVHDATQSQELDTDEWYNLGLDLEEVEPDKAPDAYKQSIRLDPKNADAHVNLGRLYQLSNNLKFAKRHYELALTARPGHQLALYNLGTVFDELDETEKAAEFYVRAPAIPDAHYNLSRIRELQGDEINARRHMSRYRSLLDTDPEAE